MSTSFVTFLRQKSDPKWQYTGRNLPPQLLPSYLNKHPQSLLWLLSVLIRQCANLTACPTPAPAPARDPDLNYFQFITKLCNYSVEICKECHGSSSTTDRTHTYFSLWNEINSKRHLLQPWWTFLPDITVIFEKFTCLTLVQTKCKVLKVVLSFDLFAQWI